MGVTGARCDRSLTGNRAMMVDRGQSPTTDQVGDESQRGDQSLHKRTSEGGELVSYGTWPSRVHASITVTLSDTKRPSSDLGQNENLHQSFSAAPRNPTPMGNRFWIA
jgi:hypothetical protein